MTVADGPDVAALVKRLAEPTSDTAMLEHTERPLFNAELGIPDHTVFLAVDSGFGYLSYQDPEFVRAFPVGDGASPGCASEFEEFPPGTGLPISEVVATVAEFLATSVRPTSVQWREPVQ